MWKWIGLVVLGLAAAAIGPSAVSASHTSDETENKQERRVERLIRVPGDRHARIGASVVDLEAGQHARGARIESVDENGPAAKAGMRSGDIIAEFDGERVRSARQLARLVGETPAGRTVGVAVLREGRRVELQVAPDPQPPAFGAFMPQHAVPGAPLLRPMPQFRFEGPESRRWFERFHENMDGHELMGRPGARRLGVTAQPLSAQLADYFGTEAGVLVASVQDDSPAAKAGLRAGDVITAVNGARVAAPVDLARAVGRAEEAEVTIAYVRDRRNAEVKVTLPTRERTEERTQPV